MADWADETASAAIYDSSNWELSIDNRVAAALRKAKADGMREAAKCADGWLANFGNVRIDHVSAHDYAVDAVKDIADLIRARADRIEKGDDA